MKKLTTFSLSLFLTLALFAQSYPGYLSGNYTGVNGAFSNPANIANSRYRWDVNLFGIHTGVANNNVSFKLNNLGDTFDDEKLDSLLFSSSNKNVNGAVNLDVYGPSFMFNINRKTSIALTTRVRAIANISDIDGKFIQSINDDFEGSLPFTLNSNARQKISVNGWTDLGITLGQVLLNKGNHFLKGGITLKYLAGAGNSYVSIDQLKGTIDENISGDVYMTDATGTVGIGYAGMDFDNFEANDAFKSNGRGIGGDIGLVYEYRPNSQKNYKFKFGISLLDIGSLKYKPKADEYGNYSINIPDTQEWSPEDLNDKSISEIKTYLDGSPYFTNNTGNISSYKVNLPTNLQINADYSIVKNIYVALAGQVNLAKKDNLYNSFYYNTISIIPRFENERFGIYIPMSYNELSKFNAGISLRAGPLFIGSGSVFTALLDNSRQADLHIGINFGSLIKK